ncbi:MAG: cyclic pyranopterin monophosphate synthase MoaC, partial [Planctomycetota bacterium JB042]
MASKRRSPRAPDRRRLTHVDAAGAARMVDVTGKEVTVRRAVARGGVRVRPATLRRVKEGTGPKGAVLETARLAGIQAAKRTWELIPLCHPIPLTSVRVDLVP